MSEMVERVARAISTSFHEEGYIEGISNPSEWNEFLKAARAAIEAMREPTSAMEEVGDTTPTTHGYTRHEVAECKPIWRAMIDAALA